MTPTPVTFIPCTSNLSVSIDPFERFGYMDMGLMCVIGEAADYPCVDASQRLEARFGQVYQIRRVPKIADPIA